MKKTSINVSIIFFYSLQMIILLTCFLLFTSTIEVFPWYEPLTMGAGMMLMVITPIQVILSLIIYGSHKSSLMYRRESSMSVSNAGFLLSALFALMLNDDLFYPLAIIGAFVEGLLAVSFIFTMIRQLLGNKR